MPYPARPVPDPLPQFGGTATVRQTQEQREALLSFVEKGYAGGKSLRELAALTDRTQTVLCTCQGPCRIRVSDAVPPDPRWVVGEAPPPAASVTTRGAAPRTTKGLDLGR